jgi:hypothetical protein
MHVFICVFIANESQAGLPITALAQVSNLGPVPPKRDRRLAPLHWGVTSWFIFTISYNSSQYSLKTLAADDEHIQI